MKGCDDMVIKKAENGFYIGDSFETAMAKITYKRESDSVIVADHTYVSVEYRGQNIAKKLLDELAIYAKEENLKIRPQCSYVVKAFERFKEYEDIKI